MRIDERIATGTEPSFSFEFFPPRTDEGERNLGRALAELSRLDPTFVSVTYGAGGSTTEKRKTIDIVAHLKRDYGLEAMAHFTCVSATADELRSMLDTMRDAGIENVLALRGDPPRGETEWIATPGGLSYSTELISLIAERLEAVLEGLGRCGEATAFDLLRDVYGELLVPETASWLLTKLLCYLDHLEARGAVRRAPGDPERWTRS